MLSINALSTRSTGAVKALLRHFQGATKALLRRNETSGSDLLSLNEVGDVALDIDTAAAEAHARALAGAPCYQRHRDIQLLTEGLVSAMSAMV